MSIITTLNKINFKCDISIPYGELQPVIEWCQDNLKDDWRYYILNEAGSAPGHYEFIFESEIDYINFLLWKK